MGNPTILSPTATRALEDAVAATEVFHTSEDSRKNKAVQAVRAGAPIAVVANAIGITRTTLYAWRDQLDSENPDVEETYGGIL